MDWASRNTGPELAWRSSQECKCANEAKNRSKEEEVEKMSTACGYLSSKKELLRKTGAALKVECLMTGDRCGIFLYRKCKAAGRLHFRRVMLSHKNHLQVVCRMTGKDKPDDIAIVQM